MTEPSITPELIEKARSAEEALDSEAAERAERRRRVRLPLKVPVTLSWMDKLGEGIEEIAYTAGVSSSGCRVALQKPLPEGLAVVCQNNNTGQARKGRIVWSDRIGKEKQSVAGIDMGELDSKFWGPEFLAALIDASALDPKPAPLPPEVVEKHDEARRGLLYALMASVLYFFLGGYSSWSVYFEVSPFVQSVLAPAVFLSGLALAAYASFEAMRRSKW